MLPSYCSQVHQHEIHLPTMALMTFLLNTPKANMSSEPSMGENQKFTCISDLLLNRTVRTVMMTTATLSLLLDCNVPTANWNIKFLRRESQSAFRLCFPMWTKSQQLMIKVFRRNYQFQTLTKVRGKEAT